MLTKNQSTCTESGGESSRNGKNQSVLKRSNSATAVGVDSSSGSASIPRKSCKQGALTFALTVTSAAKLATYGTRPRRNSLSFWVSCDASQNPGSTTTCARGFCLLDRGFTSSLELLQPSIKLSLLRRHLSGPLAFDMFVPIHLLAALWCFSELVIAEEWRSASHPPSNERHNACSDSHYQFERKIERVAVIGAGPSGLQRAAALIEHGFQVRLFERAPKPGGQWFYTDEIPVSAPFPYVPFPARPSSLLAGSNTYLNN